MLLAANERVADKLIIVVHCNCRAGFEGAEVMGVVWVAFTLDLSITAGFIEVPPVLVNLVVKVELSHTTKTGIERKKRSFRCGVPRSRHAAIRRWAYTPIALASKIIGRTGDVVRPVEDGRVFTDRVGLLVSFANMKVGQAWNRQGE